MKKNLVKKRAALYNPFLDTLGGGEKHILSILKVLEEKGYEINIFWDKNLQKQIEDRFLLQYVNKLKFLPNIFNHQRSFNPQSSLRKLRILKNFEIFFYVTDGSYFFSSAKKNFIFSMVPDKKLYNLNLINRLKLYNYRFISNSTFTSKWLDDWGIKSEVIMPYISDNLLNKSINFDQKDKLILSVGRFYPHLHTKNHVEIIKTFQKLKKQPNLFTDYKLILAGGLKKEDRQYFTLLKTLAKNDASIIFKPNVSYKELVHLYEKAKYYWHFTGLGIDETLHPEAVEHFGIAPLEAMASGCLTFCHNSGGAKEFITDSENGFLFNSEKDLTDKIIEVAKNISYQRKIFEKAKKTVKEIFSYESFKKRVKEVIL